MSDGCWLVWSREHNAWWRPNSAGYTDNVFNAGRYAEREARDICRGGRDPQRDGSPSEVAIPAPELSHIFARRVWAAWNACQGIETEVLERGENGWVRAITEKLSADAFDDRLRNEALEARLAEARAIVEDCAQWMEAVLATFAKGGATEDPGEEHLAEQIAKTRAWLENEE